MSTVYRLGLYEKALPEELNWSERLASAGKAGFDAVEISIDETPARLSRLDRIPTMIQELREAMDGTGLTVPTMCLSAHRKYPLGHPEAAVRARSLEIMDRALDLAAGAGIRIIQLAGYDVYYEPSSEKTLARFSENLEICAAMAAARGVVLGFETMETAFMDTVAKGMVHVNRVGSPWLGMYPDLGNLTNAAVLYGHDVLKDLERGRGHLFAAHLKETRPGEYRNLRFGEGHVDFAAAARCLSGLGVQLFTAECWYLGSPTWQDELKDASTRLRKALNAAFDVC